MFNCDGKNFFQKAYEISGTFDYENFEHESKPIFTDECNECDGTGKIES